ncbi:hypothetical protein [Nocardia sp. CDC160]|uniref:hypothetical protein n=1 Tax=Nocardia sp. CDC160 TaxID=3112166 RepID=UPI002DBABDE3|nr:hypothetical protein [Nocardia sp. CDC160]MEC3919285.1 hypothetical protein [Nocardia sp. CDC160]
MNSCPVVGQWLALACVAAVCAVACSASAPESATATTIAKTACADPAGAVFSIDRLPDRPITVRIPQLPGWHREQRDDVGPTLMIRRTDPQSGRTRGATITVNLREPRRRDVSYVESMATSRGWKEVLSETVEVCGWSGRRIAGTTPAQNADEVEIYGDSLFFDYDAGDQTYPIGLYAEVAAADIDFYRADLDAIRNGLQVLS